MDMANLSVGYDMVNHTDHSGMCLSCTHDNKASHIQNSILGDYVDEVCKVVGPIPKEVLESEELEETYYHYMKMNFGKKSIEENIYMTFITLHRVCGLRDHVEPVTFNVTTINTIMKAQDNCEYNTMIISGNSKYAIQEEYETVMNILMNAIENYQEFSAAVLSKEEAE